MTATTAEREDDVVPRALDVVVVDDDADGLEATLRVLRRAGITTAGADSGEAGWELIRDRRPRLALLDVVLPDVSGFDVLARIRGDPNLNDVGVIMLSAARTGIDARVDGLESGADDYITRPVSNNELLARVQVNLRQAELVHRLRESEERFRTLVTHQADALLVVGADGTIRFANAAAEQLFGVDPTALDATAFGAPLLGPDATEIEITRGDGSTVPTEMRAAASSWNGEPAWIVSLRDVSARHALEDQLRRAQRLEVVGRLTAGIAHDFNNLLAVIVGASDDLRESVREPEVRELAEMIGLAAARGADLTHRLLAVARRQLLTPTRVDVSALLRDLEPILLRTLGGLVSVEVDVAREPWSVLVDRGGLESALLNLCSNARDAMPQGGRLLIRAEDVVHTSGRPEHPPDLAPGEYVRISVEDDGTGIAPEHLDRIFEPFFTTKPHGEGTGLGLPMVYGFAQQSGGHLAIDSVVGRGTTVALYLPRVDADGAVLPEPAPAAPGRAHDEARLLVVDDDELVRTMLVRQLDRLGYDVIAVADADAALAALASDPGVALMLTDVRLGGGMDGHRLAARARDLHPGLRVVFMSGMAREGLADDEIPDGPVIGKPFRPGELAAVLEAALA